METTASANSVAGTGTYSFPSDLSVFRSMKYKGYTMKYLSFNEFNLILSGYSSTDNPYGPGIPYVFTMWQNELMVFPVPSESITDGFTLYYMRHPTNVVTTADTPDVPSQYHRAIVDYCMSQAYELDEDTGKQQIKDASFQAKMLQLNDRNKTTREYFPTITSVDEDFNGNYPGGYY